MNVQLANRTEDTGFPAAVAATGRGSAGVAQGLQRNDVVFLAALATAGVWIWMRDLAWLSAAEETLPILAALPLFAWLGSPWRFKAASWSLPPQLLVGAATLAGAGLVFDTTLLLAAAWTLTLWTWLEQRVAADAGLVRRLAVLPLMAFPWVALDLASVGWGFRLSAAWVADQLYSALGFSVVREGTNLLVQGIPIEVAAPCSGMNSLQAILMGGLTLTWMEFGRSRRYWSFAAALPLVAWVANTVRVCSLIAMAVGFGPDAARGALHQVIGWVAVLTVLVGWSFTARRLAALRAPAAPAPATPAALPITA